MNNTQVLISDIAAQVITSPAPVLFPDTCALVDLIRIPLRIKSANDAMRLLDIANHLVSLSLTTSPDLWIAIPPLVYREWVEHSQNTLVELERHWANLDNMLQVAHVSAKFAGIHLSNPATFSNRNIENVITKLSENFFKSALFIADDAGCKDKATNRVIHNIAPAQKGSELKDCIIVEHCLEVCSQLRRSGFTEKCVFITSNTKDFCEPNSRSIPREPLRSELEAIKLSLVTNWDWAKAELAV